MIRIQAEVSDALEAGRAVTALESTLITHGLPFPDNLETARASERAVRAAGAVPATIAVLRGVIEVGLTEEQLAELAVARRFLKASRRDLSAVVAGGHDAALTVSAVLAVARMVGIGVMATGGLGGVHRGAGESFDVSTDLDALAISHGVALVCSGVKSILDIPATLEVLETRGVAVIGYGTDDFPAFTSTGSGRPIDMRVDSPEAAAAIVVAHRRLGLPGAVVFAQPVPSEVALDRDEMERVLQLALIDANRRWIRGKALTPFLLDAVRAGTGGRSLVANRALIVANAGLAGEIAARLVAEETRAVSDSERPA
ncbi:MAG: pseudouridine-5'-phosphate glycosidase [Isosphaeraceae bacterium]|nr:pseudouridine-5'-phosphate glycosidase [Isosphaeraceae bacterium]